MKFKKNHNRNRSLDDERDYDENSYMVRDLEERPLVDKIIFPTKLWLKALEAGRKTYNEVGFFIIGLFRGKTCYVYNLIEFDYVEQSGAFIETGIKRAVRLRAGIPVGLHIIGNMHKHPGFLQYSNTDRRDYLRYGRSNSQNAFLIYIVDPYDGIAGYTATESEIYKIDVEIRDLELNEILIEKKVSLSIDFRMLVQKSENIKNLRFNLVDQLSSEILKNFSRSSLFNNNVEICEENLVDDINENLELIPKTPVFLKNIGFNNEMIIRVFMDPDDDLYDLRDILIQLVKIKENNISKIIFIENEKKLSNTTLISEINSVLIWEFDSTIIKKFSFKFFNEIFNLISNITLSNLYGWSE